MKKLTTRIKMMSRDEFVVSREQGDSIRQRVSSANGSVFINIPDLGVTINSANISEMLDEMELVAQKENLLGEGQMTEEDKKKRDEIIRNTRVELEQRGVLR